MWDIILDPERSPYFSYITTQNDCLIDGMLHKQPCYCDRCRLMLYEAGSLADGLLAPGESRTVTSDGCDGVMRLTVTRRGGAKKALPPPRQRPAAAQVPRRVQSQPPPLRPQPQSTQQPVVFNYSDHLRGAVFAWTQQCGVKMTWREFLAGYGRYRSKYLAWRQQESLLAKPVTLSHRAQVCARVAAVIRDRDEMASP